MLLPQPLSSLKVNPLHYHFLKNDNDLSAEIGLPIGQPIVLFNLDGLGVNFQAMQDAIANTYEQLPWDEYLVKRDQINFIANCLPEKKECLLSEVLPQYFANHIQQSNLDAFVDRFTNEQMIQFKKIKPYRRRGISQFMLHKSSDDSFEWAIEDLPHTSYSQTSEVKHDYRNLKRSFPPSPPSVTQNRQFREILVHLAVMSDIARAGKALKIKIICQQVGIVTDPDQVVSNAPEGIHQDGCDYIVSALVVKRRAISNGMSVVYGPDQKTEYLRHTLLDGEGIFQADSGTPLWHVVEPIEFERAGQSEPGVRNIIGYDIYIEQSV